MTDEKVSIAGNTVRQAVAKPPGELLPLPHKREVLGETSPPQPVHLSPCAGRGTMRGQSPERDSVPAPTSQNHTHTLYLLSRKATNCMGYGD